MKIETIAKKILSFDPDGSDFIAVGVNKPLSDSATGLTWQDIKALAHAAAPNVQIPRKMTSSKARVKLTPA